MRPPRFASLFEAVANVVPFQQLSLDAGCAIVARLVARFGQPLTYQRTRYFAFPEARAIAAARLATLRGCGLSTRKAASLQSLARLVVAGELQESRLESLSTPAALRILAELPGIGPWSAGVVLLRGLGRLDVFPPGDVGAARGLRRLMGLAPHAPIERAVERFGGQRGYLYFHVLGGSLLARGLISAAPAGRRRAPLDRAARGG
ncbi:MAG: DNA-3-methyladenine glycosylase 2 family protein [Gammaproteobacteria bacterium]|nr:DNA-3-methyladenine glycosylase 2 family protein [Gammaproteobacteria bacterium]